MVIMTIRQLLEDDNIENHGSIYVIRDSETVFYIGMSRYSTFDRVLDHLGFGSRSGWPDSTGRLVWFNIPHSFDWQVEFLEIEECEVAVKSRWPFFHHWDIETAEKALIMQLHPCMNVIHNSEPASLPDKYRVPLFMEQSRAKLVNDCYNRYRRKFLGFPE